jgi:Rrf2 family protein
MEFIKRNTDYALRALVYLAQKEPGEIVYVRTIAEQEQVSEDFLRKILQVLANAGIVDSHRGPRGGFSLAKEAADISVLDVMEALQGPVAINRCFLGKDKCPNYGECDLRNRLVGVQETIVRFLGDIDLAQLLSAEGSGAGGKPVAKEAR